MALQILSLWLFDNLPSRTVNKSPPMSVFSLQSEANGAKKKSPRWFPHLPFTPPWTSKREQGLQQLAVSCLPEIMLTFIPHVMHLWRKSNKEHNKGPRGVCSFGLNLKMWKLLLCLSCADLMGLISSWNGSLYEVLRNRRKMKCLRNNMVLQKKFEKRL